MELWLMKVQATIQVAGSRDREETNLWRVKGKEGE